MKIEIIKKRFEMIGDDVIIESLGTCVCDNIARALEIWEDRCEHNEYLTYKTFKTLTE